jgi:CBS domain-containing protein
MRVSDIMRRSFASIRADASLLDAANLLIETNQRGLPVVDADGSVLGMISEGDFLRRAELDVDLPQDSWFAKIIGSDKQAPSRQRMSALVVGEVMTRHPVCISDEALVSEVVALMSGRRIAQLPVVCGDTLVGVVSRVELLEAVASVLRAAKATTGTLVTDAT